MVVVHSDGLPVSPSFVFVLVKYWFKFVSVLFVTGSVYLLVYTERGSIIFTDDEETVSV